jgi:NAD(P)-dependent dehydrogenase (short-subunit alcohol dehydrogenase family)
MSMQGKSVVVTGAASGIGAATAHLMKAAGALVIGLDRSPISENVDLAIAYDQSDEASIDAAAAKIDGPIDALCNVAGVAMSEPPPLVLKVNFLGVRRLTEQLERKFNSNAAVVSLASIGGMAWRDNLDEVKALMAVTSIDDAEQFCADHGVEPALSYKLTKEAVVVWTMANALDWADRNVRFNCVSPGPVESPLYHNAVAAAGERGQAIAAKTRRIAEPEEIAQVLVYLCSDQSGWVNGANVPIDGGLACLFLREQLEF